MTRKKQKLNQFILLLAGGIFIIIFTILMTFPLSKRNLRLNSNPENDFASFTANLPERWTLRINDESNCHEIIIYNQGKFYGNLGDYVKKVVIGENSKVDLSIHPDTYNIYSPNVIDLGVTGVLNKNTIYIKSAHNNIFLLLIHNTIYKTEIQNSDNSTCNDLRPLVQYIVNFLLET